MTKWIVLVLHEDGDTDEIGTADTPENGMNLARKWCDENTGMSAKRWLWEGKDGASHPMTEDYQDAVFFGCITSNWDQMRVIRSDAMEVYYP